MNVEELPPYTREFLAHFFGPGNRLRLDSMGRSSMSVLKPWFENLAEQDDPVLLPRVDEQDGTRWYAIAFSERRARELREEIEAFVGPTYSDFDGRVAQLDPDDPIESACSRLENASVFSFRVINSEDQGTVREALSRMRELWDARPPRRPMRVQTTNRLLRDFEMALEVTNEESARKLLATLKSEGRLSSQNYLFLKLRLLATFQRWSEILKMPESSAVLHLQRRPQLVNEALLQAIYAEELRPFEIAGEPEEALQHFRENVWLQYPQLFKSRGALTAPAVMKSFMMLAAVSDPPRPETRDRILQEYPKNAGDRPYLEQLSSRVGDTKTHRNQSPLSLAQEARRQNDFDQAFQYLKKARAGEKKLELMLRCAFEINTLEAAQWTLEVFSQAPEETREQVLATRQAKKFWEELRELGEVSSTKESTAVSPSDEIPEDWVGWLQRLNQEGAWASAWRVAKQGALEWNEESVRSSPKEVHEIADLLEQQRSEDARAVLRNAIPLLLRFFLPDGQPEQQYRSIYESLLYLLALDSQLSRDDLTAAHELTLSLLQTGLSEDQYSDVIQLLGIIWGSQQAPKTTGWALDILDALLAYPCQDRQSRQEFFSQVLGSVQGFARRLRSEQWELFELICEDFDVPKAIEGLRPEPDPDEDVESRTVADLLRGKSIAIYTLTESVSRRVSELLERKFDGVSVTISNAHAATNRLRTMARNADIFLVATSSAKHAATEFISAERPSDKPVLYPQGKGSSSMLRVLYEYLEE